MADIKAKYTNPEDIIELAENIADADRDEIMLKHGIGCDVLDVLWTSLEASTVTISIFVDDILTCIFGVAYVSPLSDEGYIWMVNTKNMSKCYKDMLRYTPECLKIVCGDLRKVSNYVSERNKRTIKWLKWMGFKFNTFPVRYGVEGKPFYKFWMEFK